MPSRLIKADRIVDDPFTTIEPPADSDPATIALPEGSLIVPLDVWRARREELLGRDLPAGVRLRTTDVPGSLGDDLARLAVVAVHFPKFVDGRGYSIAWQLRRRLGFRGELRAVGDVQRDQLFYLSRSGFDAFELKDGIDPRAALASLRDFTTAYQQSADGRVPRFRAAATPDARPG